MAEILAGTFLIVFAFYATFLSTCPVSLETKLDGMLKKGEPWELFKVEIYQAYNKYLGMALLFLVFIYQYFVFVEGININDFLKSSYEIKYLSAFFASGIFFILAQIKHRLVKKMIKKYRKKYRLETLPSLKQDGS